MHEWTVTRRQLLGAVAATALAGCSEFDAESDDESHALATAAATIVENRRASWVRTTRRLARVGQLRSGTDDERQRYLRGESKDLAEAVLRVNLVDPASRTVVASTSPAKEGEPLNMREAPWQTDAIEYRDDGVFVSEAVTALATSLLSVVTPVMTDTDREPLLVLQADLDAVAGELPAPADGFTQIVDDEGRVVSGNRYSDTIFTPPLVLQAYEKGADAPALRRGLAGESGAVRQTRPDEEQTYRVAFAPVAGADWVALVHEPVESALELPD